MGQFLQVNGDYNIKAGEGARITLDTGLPASGGEVRVTGNLIVEGITVSVAATNLDLTDNIITLNSGETFEGVFKDYAGFEVDRGFYADSSAVPRAVLLYAEPTDLVDIEDADPRPTWLIANNSAPGPFNFDESNLKLRRILTDIGTDSGDLTLIGSGTGVVKVIGTANYEDQVTHDDDLPNKKYVDTAIQTQPTFQIVAPTEDTRVIVVDKDILSGFGSEAYLSSLPGTYDTDGESAVSFLVDGNLVAQVYQDRVLIGRNGLNGLVIDGPNYEIRTEPQVNDQNIYIKTDGTGKLQTNYALQLDLIAPDGPNYVSGSTLVYGRTPEIGDSGVWYVNDNLQVNKRKGELVSKNRALLFSMIF
jgi:hypothetical protein